MAVKMEAAIWTVPYLRLHLFRQMDLDNSPQVTDSPAVPCASLGKQKSTDKTSNWLSPPNTWSICGRGSLVNFFLLREY